MRTLGAYSKGFLYLERHEGLMQSSTFELLNQAYGRTLSEDEFQMTLKKLASFFALLNQKQQELESQAENNEERQEEIGLNEE